MTGLKLSLFGPFRASLNGVPLTEFRTRKVQALLVYLVVSGEAQDRVHLLHLLWPGMPRGSARSNLRQIIYYLRQAIPEVPAQLQSDTEAVISVPLLLTNRGDIYLNQDAAIDSDVRRFTKLLEQVYEHHHPDPIYCVKCHQHLAAAVALYQGDFLADLYLDDSDEFESWAQTQREHFRHKVIDALGILTAIAIGQKSYSQAQALAERQLEIDNLHEVAHRQLMEALARAGRRQEALEIYDSYRQRLLKELSMAPSAYTTALHEKIQTGALHLDPLDSPRVHGYQLLEQIGAGAHDVVHRALQTTVGRQVVVKIIQKEYTNEPEFIRRFETEAQMVARLEHPHIVPLYDFWRHSDGAYLVMRYLQGGSLLQALEDGPWPPARVARMLDQLAAALTVAHRQQIVHRDIKPANILLDEDGNAYLSDFGIAKELSQSQGITTSIVGTPDYISPEQIKNEPVSPQSDLYSLGAVLYETLTGEKPFADTNLAALLDSHLNKPLPLVGATRPDVPPSIDTVLQQATAKEPAHRFDNALVMAAAFRQALGGLDGAAALDVTGPPEELVGEIYNPYKGLRAFQEADAEDFFGREALVQQLINRLAITGWQANRFLAVVGPSGSGKSSVVKAGLIPALRNDALPGSQRWFIIHMVPGTHPFEELEQALWPIAVDPPPSLVDPMRRDTCGLLRTIQRILPNEQDAQLVLVIDQFEELFTLVDDEQRRLFFIDSLLAALNASSSPLRVVITLRADFYDRPLQIQNLGQLLKENTEIILPLDETELARAIREPALRMGVEVEAGLTELIAADVVHQPGTLPLLQYALTELFEGRQGNRITRTAYDAIGGVASGLTRRAEAIHSELDLAERTAARQIFLRLITLGEGVDDTRRRVLRRELEASADSAATVIDTFGRFRLLTFDRDPGTRQPTVEVAHETLLREWPRLRGWLGESRDDVRLQRLLAQAAHDWKSAGQEDDFLLRGTRLDQFASWAQESSVALTTMEQEFLDASAEARAARRTEEDVRRQRELATALRLAEAEKSRAAAETQRAETQARSVHRLRRLSTYLVVALLVTVMLAAAAIFFARQSQTAEREALRQASIGLASQAVAELDSDTPERGVLLALEALSQYPYTPQAERALAQTVYGTRQFSVIQIRDIRAVAAAFAPDGKRLATSGVENVVAIWDVDSGDRRLSFGDRNEIGANNFSLDWSPDGRVVAVASRGNNQVQLWDTVTGQLSLTFAGHAAAVNTVAFSAQGQLALSAGADGTARVWDVTTGHEKLVLSVSDDIVTDARWSPNEEQIATTSLDGTLSVWDSNSGILVWKRPAHPDGALAVAWSPTGAELATAGADGAARIWDVQTGTTVHSLIGHRSEVRDVEWSPDGLRLATVSADGIAHIWDRRSLAKQFTLLGGDTDTRTVDWSPDGKQLVVSAGFNIRIWDMTDQFIQVAGHEFAPGQACCLQSAYWMPMGRYLVTSGLDSTGRVWDTETGQQIGLQRKYEFSTLFVGGDRLYFSLDGEAIERWNPLTNERSSIPISDPAVYFVPATTRIIGTNFQANSIVFDLESGRKELEVIHDDCVFGGRPAWSPDESLFSTTCFSGESKDVLIWNAATGELVHRLIGHTDGQLGNRWSPDGKRLVTSGADNTARVWDTETGEELLVFSGHTEFVFDVSWSPDGSRIASGDTSSWVRIWDSKTGEEVNAYKVAGSIFTVDWSPNGQWVAAAGAFPAPDIRPVWATTEELITYAQECCVFRDLTPGERIQFGLAEP